MFKLTMRELAAHKLRLVTTAFAVLLGVAFMAGTLVFTETIGAAFDSTLAEANEGVDAYVRTPSAIDVGYGEPGPRLDASIAQNVATVDGVDEIALRINGYAQLVGPDGEPVGDVANSPAFGTNWVVADDLNPYELSSGRAPSNDDEIVIDKASAEKARYQPGDVATVLTKSAPRQFTIAGIATFGTADSPAGATAVLFTDATATELLAAPGQADAIAVTADAGWSQADVAAAVQTAVGDDVEVITGAALIAEDQASMADLLAGMSAIFVVFALVAVVVGAFIINNTFAITVAQRTRQMAMLRAIGASGRQVKRSVLIEAAAVGVLAVRGRPRRRRRRRRGAEAVDVGTRLRHARRADRHRAERDRPVVRSRRDHHCAVGVVARVPFRQDLAGRRAAGGQRRPLGRLGAPRDHRFGVHRRWCDSALRRSARRVRTGRCRRTGDTRRDGRPRPGARPPGRQGVRRAAPVARAQR